MILPALICSVALAMVGVDEDPKPLTQSTLIRWSQTEPVVGVVGIVNEQGVPIQIEQQVIPTLIPWYEVRSLKPADAKYDQYQLPAQDAWRAHLRLIRGDFFGAETIYNQLEDQYLWNIGPQSADVSLGLMQCRLDRQDRVSAVLAMVSWIGANRDQGLASLETNDQAAADQLDGFDPEHQLMVALPPIFSSSDRFQALASMPDSEDLSSRQRALYGYFELALHSDIHRTVQAEEKFAQIERLIRGRERRDTGIDLIADMVAAQAHPSSQIRKASIAALKRQARTNPGTWIEVWARLAIGVSLLADEDTRANERGIIELVHIIVRLNDVSRPLAQLASEIANEYLARTDRVQWGNDLKFQSRNAWARQRGESKN
ncbi:MAG: hypothetical protein JKX70_10560 [Phycisphaerales bacterium]|nr:hypothetical protein [Phycisphaerales bacterium]